MISVAAIPIITTDSAVILVNTVTQYFVANLPYILGLVGFTIVLNVVLSVLTDHTGKTFLGASFNNFRNRFYKEPRD